MSDDSKSFEKKLDRDFLYYLNLTKSLFGNITEAAEQQLCEVWLTHLLGRTITSVAEKCDRNIYLSRLLLQMQNGKLKEIFLETPPGGPLPCAFTTFNLPTEVEGLKGYEEMGFQIDSSVGGHFGDFSETSRDGRTYLATRHLPQGIMAYIAVTNNEGEPAWLPQTRRAKVGFESPEQVKRSEGYTKRLASCVDESIFASRKSPEERDKLLDWMDKTINDCNSWIQGKDPKNMELEVMFEQLYEMYKTDPENSELLKHPKSVRTILFKDIRDKIIEKRAMVSKREFILDKYETDQYVEESDVCLDEVWLECAKRPLKDQVKSNLDAMYPPEVVKRFTELLYRERLLIIQKGEKEAKKKISELRQASIEDTKKELQKLKKIKNEYKEFHSIYKNIEEQVLEFKKEFKEKCLKPEKANQEAMEKFKQERENEIQQAKRNLDREVKAQNELSGKLEEALEIQRKVKERIASDVARFDCEANIQKTRKENLQAQVNHLRKKRCELMREISIRKNQCGC